MRGLSILKHSWFWVLVPIVVVAEVVQQWRIPRQDPSEADWLAAVDRVTEEKTPRDLVVIAPDWAVQGRMYFKELMTMADFGRFDTTTYERLFEVGIAGARAPETEGMTPEKVDEVGRLRISGYRLPKPAKIRYNFTENWKAADYEKTGRRPPKIVIDHWFHPRRVLQIDIKQKSSITFDDVPLGGVLRGYAVIGYREGRYNKGAPIRLTTYLNDKKIGEERVANFSPVEPFTYRLPGTGKGTVRFEVFAKDNKKREFGIACDVRKGDR